MKENNEKIGPGKFVAFTYKLSNAENGELLFEARQEAPDTMIYGITSEVIPGLQNVMKGLSVKDRFSVTLPPEVAFGQKYDENVITLPLSTFERDGKVAEEVKIGAMLPMLTEDGYTVTGQVKDITADSVVMDFNHPFAGLTVKFDGEIAEVRDATPEELQPKHSCGCGCSHSHGEEGCGCNHDEEGCCHGHGDHGCDCGDDCGCSEEGHNCGCK